MITTVKHQMVAAALSVAMLLMLAGCQSDEKQAQDYLKSAIQYYDSGQYSLASVEIKNAIRKDSSLAEPYLLQARIFAKKKEWEAMHAFLLTTLQQQPRHVEANIEIAKLYAKGRNIATAQKHLDIAVKEGSSQFDQHLVQGMIYMNDHKLEQAMEQSSAALALEPESIDATILSASLFTRQEKYQQALDVTNKTLQKHPQSTTLILMKSKIYSMQGQFEQAAQHAKTLTTLVPKELSYHYLLAALRDRAGDKKGAERALQEATQANPTSSKARIALAGYISQQDKTQAAIDLLSLYIESEADSGNEELQLILAELYQKQGQIDRASDIYKNLADTDDKFAYSAKNKLALIALKDNRQQEALAILNDVLKSDFSNTEALITRSIIHLADRRTDQAITDLLSAVRETPDSELALMLLARAYKQNKNNELTLQTLNKLLKVNPAHHDAIVQYSQLLYEEQQYKAAIESLKKYMENAEPSDTVQQQLMNALLADKNWSEAETLAQTIATASRQPEYVNYTKALILQRTQQYAQSTRILQSLIQKNIFVHQSLKAIIYNYRKLNNINEGLDYLSRYSTQHPNDLFVVNLLVFEYRREQQFSQAEKVLTNALTHNKDWVSGHLQLAKLFAAQAKWQEAIASGSKAMSNDKDEPALDVLLLLASSYEQINDRSRAEYYYRKALERSPNILSAANNLALLVAGDGKDRQRTDEALRIAKRFEQSNQPLFIDTLGWIHFLHQDYRQAVILLEKAVYGAPEQAVIHYHLGATLLKLSEFDKARIHLQKALELGKTSESFKEYDAAKALLEQHTL